MPRGKRDWVDDLVDITARVPWWAWVALATASSLLLHWLSAPGAPAPSAPRAGNAATGNATVRGLSLIGRYGVPLLLLALAVTSAFGRSKRGAVAGKQKVEPDWTRKRTTRMHSRGSTGNDSPGDAGTGEATGRKTAPPPCAVREDRWSFALLKRLEWKRFEYVCAAYFEELGFRAKTARTGPDAGMSIQLFDAYAHHPGIIVQCRARNALPVGVTPVRDLLGVMKAKRVREGIFVTTSSYTSEAKQFARGKNIHLIDLAGLLSLLLKLDGEQQQRVLAIATLGDYTTPSCPSCDIKMVLRTPGAAGKPFWGCRHFPRCRAVLPADAAGNQRGPAGHRNGHEPGPRLRS